MNTKKFVSEELNTRFYAIRKNQDLDPENKRMVVINKSGTGFTIPSPLNDPMVEAMTSIEGCLPVSGQKAWMVPFTTTACVQLLGLMEKHQYYFSRNAAMKIITLLQLKIDGLTCTLRPYQHESLSFALEHKRVLVGDEDGLGKTVVALAAIQLIGGPALVVTTAQLKAQWQSEIKEKLPGKTICVLNGGKPCDIEASDVVIINYDVLSKRQEELKKMHFSVVSFDESYALKDSETNQCRAARQLATRIQYCILLSGKSFDKHPIDLWGQLMVMGKTHVFKSLKKFIDTFCDAQPAIGRYGNEYSNKRGAAKISELLLTLGKECYICHLKLDVLP
jgi:SNF2 family DNA or RNA helicase